MRGGQKIEIQLVDDVGRAVQMGNVLATITFFSGGHLRYVFDLNPTGSDGRTTAEFDELDVQRAAAGLNNLMDYNTALNECDREVEISVPSEAQLRKRQEAVKQWNPKTIPAWLLQWPVNGYLAPVRPVRVAPSGPVTVVDIVVALPTAVDG